MKSLWISLALVATFAVAGKLPISAQSPEQLYQKGLMKEEGEGALQDAITLYSQIADNGNADQSLRAKALLHIGMCYEKMGTQEAVRAYQRLVTSFPTQKNEVAIATERLNRLLLLTEAEPEILPTPQWTKLKIPTKLSWSVCLSPDGEDLALISDKKLWVMPLKGNLGPDIPGTPLQLNTGGIEVEWTGLSWSRDGKWIAFNECPRKDDQGNAIEDQCIYMVSSEGGVPKKLVENYRDWRVVNYRISLTPDGKDLAFSSVEDKKQHIYTISTDGGEPTQLINSQAREPVFSPDGRLIAYVEDKHLGRGEGDLGLWVIPAKGGTPLLVADAGMASSPVWAPDGSMIAYLDYTKGKQINIIPISRNGSSAGNVSSIPVPEGIEEVRLLAGWTPDQKIGALMVSNQEFGLFTLPATGGQAAKVLHDRIGYQPRWSRDGKQIFYVTLPEEGENRFTKLFLASIPATGGTVDSIPSLSPSGEMIRHRGGQSGNRISPDGRWILSSAWLMSDTGTYKVNGSINRIWKISVTGKESIQITSEKGQFADGSPCWSPDGTEVAFVRVHFIEGRMDPYGDVDIYKINSTGDNSVLLSSISGNYVNSLTWSPDGNTLAYLTCEINDPHTKHLNLLDVKTLETKIVGEVPAVHMNIEMAWSPDSKRIAFNDDEGKVIKIMNLEDGNIEDIETGLVDVSIYHLDWSPDGKKFVFGGYQGGDAEFWFLEDFLPLEKLPGQSGPALAAEPEGIRIRKVWETPYMDYLGTVSYDGKFRTCVYWGLGDVAIHNLETDEIQQLTHDANLGENFHFAADPTFSKDGKRIAYSWCNPYNTNDLWIINVDDLSKELLYTKEGEELYPAAWLTDDELVVARYFPDSRRNQILICNVQDKTLRVKKDFDGINSFQGIVCSQDEKYIAYGCPNKAENGNLDINLLVADGNEDIPLISHPANDKVFGWVPGKNVFLFISDRSGTWDLWGVPMNDRHTAGPAKLIYTDLGDVSPVGFTSDGTCYYGFTRRNFYSSISPFNKETGTIELGSSETMSGSNFGITWSPDGQHLAYLRIDKIRMVVQDLQTGKELDLTELKTLPNTYCWSSDGKSILVAGGEESKRGTEGYKGELVQVDLETGRTEEIFQLSDYEYNLPEDDRFPLSRLEQGVDGESFYYLFFKDRLVKHDLKTGKDEVLYRNSNFEPDVLSLSPDGKNLLFGITYPDEQKSRLFLIPAEGGAVNEICTKEGDGWLTNAFWSPDGQYIYYIVVINGMQTNLWRVLSEGGAPEKVWSSENRVDIFDIHPDGTRVSLSIRERKTEVRAIENLPHEIASIFNVEE
jgi:Tol biopolymer transport system component